MIEAAKKGEHAKQAQGCRSSTAQSQPHSHSIRVRLSRSSRKLVSRRRSTRAPLHSFTRRLLLTANAQPSTRQRHRYVQSAQSQCHPRPLHCNAIDASFAGQAVMARDRRRREGGNGGRECPSFRGRTTSSYALRSRRLVADKMFEDAYRLLDPNSQWRDFPGAVQTRPRRDEFALLFRFLSTSTSQRTYD